MKYVWTFSLYIKTRCVYMKTIINKFLLVIFFYFIFLNNFSVFYDPQLYPRLFTHEVHPVSNVELQTVIAADHVYSLLIKRLAITQYSLTEFPSISVVQQHKYMQSDAGERSIVLQDCKSWWRLKTFDARGIKKVFMRRTELTVNIL